VFAMEIHVQVGTPRAGRCTQPRDVDACRTFQDEEHSTSGLDQLEEYRAQPASTAISRP
jgi:hypothetical protein